VFPDAYVIEQAGNTPSLEGVASVEPKFFAKKENELLRDESKWTITSANTFEFHFQFVDAMKTPVCVLVFNIFGTHSILYQACCPVCCFQSHITWSMTIPGLTWKAGEIVKGELSLYRDDHGLKTKSLVVVNRHLQGMSS